MQKSIKRRRCSHCSDIADWLCTFQLFGVSSKTTLKQNTT